jgi:hypothetical protein
VELHFGDGIVNDAHYQEEDERHYEDDLNDGGLRTAGGSGSALHSVGRTPGGQLF